MCTYGDSPLAYACVFGLRKLTSKMLDSGLVSLDTNPGEIIGLYPLHAVVSNGRRSEYDFLTRGLPLEERADRSKCTEAGRLITLGMEQMNCMQLAADRGLRFMFQHIMSQETTRIMWTWGRVTQFQCVYGIPTRAPCTARADGGSISMVSTRRATAPTTWDVGT